MAEERITTINLGSQHVAGAVFSKTPGGGLTLSRYQRSELLGDPGSEGQQAGQLKVALTEVIGGLKAKGESPGVVISGQPVFIRFVKLPPLDIDQVDQIVEFEAQQQVPFPINEVVWNYQLMGTPDDPDVDVLLAAIKSDELDEIDGIIQGVGLKPTGVEVAPMALFNAFRFNYSDLEGTTLIIDIGARTTNLIFVEGPKMFLRTIKIGGLDITRAIAKEFNVDFHDAEQRKIADGFVALGGPYADHDDPVIAGVSKVIRNSLTRLHSEIMRTTNFYRSQQGGRAPEIALLSGATVGLPFIREFFAEKLNIPIDYFNALRNVTVGGGVDAEAMAAKAHTLGEMVGAALQRSGSAPVSLELVPESVKKAQEFQRRKPYLMVATVTLSSLLAALGFWYMKAGEIAEAKSNALSDKESELSEHSAAIKDLKAQLGVVEAKKEPFWMAVTSRAYWTAVFNDLSQRMDTDLMWITVLEPLSGGEPVVDDFAEDALKSVNSGVAQLGAQPAADRQPAAPKMIDAIRLRGLYRKNDRGADIVVDYLANLRESTFFDLKDRSTSEVMIKADPATQYSGQWEMILPLPENARISFTK
ncbi:MAG: pilus assembly protein PilM [Verrucomicrobiae bacterium]|nr:pilus assembly protein PilM [Verrucomicrobiae bacterium]